MNVHEMGSSSAAGSRESIDQLVGPRPPKYRNQILASTVICLGPVAMGTVLGYSSPAVNDMNRPGRKFHLDSSEVSLFSSLITLGALVGGLIAGPMIDFFGRKFCLMLTVVPYVLGWLLIAYSNRALDGHLAMLYTGRVVTGLCAGISSLCAPVYISEIASPQIRGILGSGFQLFVNLGILLAYVAGTYVSWSYLALGSALIPVLLLVLIIPMPESPSWSVRNGRRDDALQALTWLRGPDADVREECEIIEENLHQETRMRFLDFLRPELLKPLLIMLVEMFLQQVSGVNAVVFNAGTIFKTASPHTNANEAAIIVAAVMVIATLFALFLVDRVGRRFLLLISALFMAIGTASLGGYYFAQFQDEKLVQNIQWLPVVCLVFFVFAFNLGYGPIPWLMMGEVFPSQARGLASSVITATNWMFAFIVTKTFVNLQDAIHNHGTFWLFASLTALGIVFVWRCVPETKGKSLDEIQLLFGNSRQILETDLVM